MYRSPVSINFGKVEAAPLYEVQTMPLLTTLIFFSNLSQNLIEKLPTGPNTFDINSVVKSQTYWSKVLATPIAQMCNLSIKLSTVPNECKIGKPKSLYRKGKKTNPKYHRPISLLPVISEILEKVIHNQTMCFVTKKICYTNFNQVFKNFTP